MRNIRGFILPFTTDTVEINSEIGMAVEKVILPIDSKILSVEYLYGNLHMWAIIDTERTGREFYEFVKVNYENEDVSQLEKLGFTFLDTVIGTNTYSDNHARHIFYKRQATKGI